METIAHIIAGWIFIAFLIAFLWCVAVLIGAPLARWWRSLKRKPVKRWVAGTGTQGRGW